MGRKGKKHEEEKPWCFYCDREFDDEKILIQHQRAKVRTHQTNTNSSSLLVTSPKSSSPCLPSSSIVRLGPFRVPRLLSSHPHRVASLLVLRFLMPALTSGVVASRDASPRSQ